uniref:LisH domain-containing protein n=1 Tax=Macrostomum lignano TaxID=282301 RepID=A0A1I8I8N3_9PLAT
MVQTKGQLAFIYRFLVSYLEKRSYTQPIGDRSSKAAVKGDPKPLSVTATNQNEGRSNDGFHATENELPN